MLPDLDEQVSLVMAAGVAVEPETTAATRGAAYPIAVDRGEGAGAVSFAVYNPYPDIERGWWCVAYAFPRGEGQIGGGYHWHDNTTSSNPFVRPEESENSVVPGIGWASNGPLLGNDDEGWLHSYFGIAPTTTARLTVAPVGSAPRDLAITPWNGAYVAAVAARGSTLRAYDEQGREIGSMTYPTASVPEEH
jgi:hypothetical protein